eukprot:CAMPEP_0171058490 /NCGR_PEP_ID=MMETSP0766_2-20121228/2526_1 /TAXON_ID=439317 /ORGANISM="Gambierdiscus australes, Strain CAWD 149" /LENGTH=327 /DNA_ID=CAMNT_0011513775 /DNA_START=128 /DNA_END=1111 /DNA_ORIENTATION=+
MKAGALSRRPWDERVHFEDLKELVVAVPKPSHGEVLIEVAGSSVNPVDWKLIESPLSLIWHYPHVFGRDCAGRVVALGEGVSRLKLGDRVWADSSKEGCFAQYAVLEESTVGLAPGTVPLQEAAVLPLVSLTGLEAFTFAQAPWSPRNKTVLVLGGSGGTGHTGIQLAKAMGAGRVISTCGTSHLDFCASMGADEVIDYHKADWHAVLAPQSVDVVYDTVALKGTGDRAYDVLRDGGFFVTLLEQGLASVGAVLRRPSLSQKFFLMASANFSRLDTLKAIVDKGGLRGHVSRTFTFAQVAQAFNVSIAGHTTGKISVVPTAGPSLLF